MLGIKISDLIEHFKRRSQSIKINKDICSVLDADKCSGGTKQNRKTSMKTHHIKMYF